MKKLALVLAILMTGAVALASMLHARAYEPFRAYAAAEQIVTIPRGTATPAIGRLLVDAGVVRDVTTFRVAVWLSGDARRLQAGEYRFDRPLSALDVLAKIARGDVVLLALTFPEGLTIPEIARGTTARAVVERMVDRFDEVLTPDLRDQARGRYLSVRQLVTLASLVEKETARSDERPTVAGVYANRLRIGMPLQCDPTVIYALQQAGRYDGNIRRADLAFESPYNTYRYPGLPPGPIAAPGQGALEAAAAPAEVPYLYFVSRNDGSHVFARTLAEHNRNVRQYQIEYFREQRRRAREEGR
jgi:UPF0755 protein